MWKTSPHHRNQLSSIERPLQMILRTSSTRQAPLAGPREWVNSHRSFTRRGDIRRAALGLSRSDRCANVRSGGVSSGFNNTLMPLLVGACLFPFDLHQHGLHKLSAWLLSEKITYISFSGSMLRTWLASLPEDAQFPSLRFIMVGGERLYGQDAARSAPSPGQLGHRIQLFVNKSRSHRVAECSHLPISLRVAVSQSDLRSTGSTFG